MNIDLASLIDEDMVPFTRGTDSKGYVHATNPLKYYRNKYNVDNVINYLRRRGGIRPYRADDCFEIGDFIFTGEASGADHAMIVSNVSRDNRILQIAENTNDTPGAVYRLFGELPALFKKQSKQFYLVGRYDDRPGSPFETCTCSRR